MTTIKERSWFANTTNHDAFQTVSNLLWSPNMLILKWVAKRLKHVWSNTYQTIWNKPLSKRGTHACIKHVWYAAVQTNKTSPIKHGNKTNILSCLIECLMAFKFIEHDQTRSNSTKQGGQTVKCLVTKTFLMVFGHQKFLVCTGLKTNSTTTRRLLILPFLCLYNFNFLEETTNKLLISWEKLQPCRQLKQTTMMR